MSAETIQFTQEQARDIALVSPGDVRAWRKTVPYLASKLGKSARFTFTDLVGLAITRELTGRYGVRISDIGTGIDALFHVLADARPQHLEGIFVLLSRNTARLFTSGEFTLQQLVESTFVIPCDPILARIGGRMMPISPGSSQTALPFPPRVLKAL